MLNIVKNILKTLKKSENLIKLKKKYSSFLLTGFSPMKRNGTGKCRLVFVWPCHWQHPPISLRWLYHYKLIENQPLTFFQFYLLAFSANIVRYCFFGKLHSNYWIRSFSTLWINLNLFFIINRFLVIFILILEITFVKAEKNWSISPNIKINY